MEFDNYLKSLRGTPPPLLSLLAACNTAVERLNRTLKAWLQEVGVGASIQTHLANRLAAYKAPQHCSTGRSPSELLHGRKMLLWLPVIGTRTVGTDVILGGIRFTVVDTLSKCQARRHAVQVPGFRERDYVLMRNSGHVPKTYRRLSRPRRIISQKGLASSRMDDWSVRNAAHLAQTALKKNKEGTT